MVRSEDLSGHHILHSGLAFQTALENDRNLATPPTLCRFENRMDREAVIAIHKVLLEQIIAFFNKAPKRLILDFDTTDYAVYGKQAGRFIVTS